ALDALGVIGEAERGRMTEYVLATMGESKITVFRALFPGDEQRAQHANRAFADALLEHLGWRTLIDLSLTPQDVGGRGRPHADLVLAAAAGLADGDPA